MDNTLNLLGGLILALLGLILPLITILLSLLPDGVRILTNKYENEKKQSEDNILNEVSKRSTENIDLTALEKTIKTLKKNKKDAESKLSFLNPNGMLSKIALPLLVSFCGIIVLFQHPSLYFYIAVSILVALFLIKSLRVLVLSFKVLFEVSAAVSENKQGSQEKIVELLSKLVEKEGSNSDHLVDTVSLVFNKIFITPKREYSFSVNKQYSILVSINNSGEIMAKKVEVGLVFPKEFLIEKTTNIDSLFTGEQEQIIRFKEEYVQASTNAQQGELKITFLKAGVYKVWAFIKGENHKNTRVDFIIKVID